MERLTGKKRSAVIRLYFSGLAYDQVALKAGVAKGSVVNVVSQLKAGQSSEIGDLGEQVEELRELAVDLHRLKLTAGDALVGISMFRHVRALGVEPAEVSRWAAMCRELDGHKLDLKAFVGAALTAHETLIRTGFTPQELEERVEAKETDLRRLETKTKALKNLEDGVQKLEKQKRALHEDIEELEAKRIPLALMVGQREMREARLAERVEDLEGKAHAAENKIAAARRDLRDFAELGLSQEDLRALLFGITRMTVAFKASSDRVKQLLFGGLETVGAGLRLDKELERRKAELQGISTACRKASAEKAALDDSILILERNHALSLQQLQDISHSALRDIEQLSGQALAVGRSIGSLESTVQNHRWITALDALLRGDPEINLADLRIALIGILRAMVLLIEHTSAQTSMPILFKPTLSSLLGEVERWSV